VYTAGLLRYIIVSKFKTKTNYIFIQLFLVRAIVTQLQRN
jgi:hypothetical protein